MSHCGRLSRDYPLAGVVDTSTALANLESYELMDGSRCGVLAFEVTSLPFHDQVVRVDEKQAEHRDLFHRLVIQLHRFTTATTAAELLFFSEKTENQAFRSRVRMFLIIRSIGRDHGEVEFLLGQQGQICRSLLGELRCGYQVLTQPSQDMAGLLDRLAGHDLYSVVKKEHLVGSMTPVTSYYYLTDLLPRTAAPMDGIFSLLAASDDVALSLQLLPTTLDDDEKFSIQKAANLLDRIAQGFPDDYYGEIRDGLAERPALVYRYYHDYADSVFRYNICVVARKDAALPILAQLESLLSGSAGSGEPTALALFSTPASVVDYRDSFLTVPWNLAHDLSRQQEQSDFWQRDDAPRSIRRLPFLVSAEEASTFFRLPIAVNRPIAGVLTEKPLADPVLIHEGIADPQNIRFGQQRGTPNPVPLGIPLEAMAKHMFISGMPGSGKSTFAQSVLFQLHERQIPFLVIEPAKSEYRALVHLIPELQVFTPGTPQLVPFSLNPFVPPRKVPLHSYRSSLLTAFGAAFDMEGPLRALFTETIQLCYQEHGWRDTSTVDDRVVLFGMHEFVTAFKSRLERAQYSAEVRNNIQTAGILRLMDLINQDFVLFDTTQSVPIEDLLRRPTILELDAIGNAEQKSLVTALLLVKIFAYLRANVPVEHYGRLNHVLLLEEAHVLLGARSRPRDSGQANPLDTAAELVNRVLAEMRATGLGMIIADQSPGKVSMDTLRNTATKVVFKTAEKGDRTALAESMNLGELDEAKLATLKPGEAYVFFERLDTAQAIQTPNFRAERGLQGRISDEDLLERGTYWSDGSRDNRPYPECRLIPDCPQQCSYQLRAEARYLADLAYSRFFMGRNATGAVFVDAAKNLGRLFEGAAQQGLDPTQRQLVFRCAKVHLLRKLHLETNLPLSLSQREELLENPRFVN